MFITLCNTQHSYKILKILLYFIVEKTEAQRDIAERLE